MCFRAVYDYVSFLAHESMFGTEHAVIYQLKCFGFGKTCEFFYCMKCVLLSLCEHLVLTVPVSLILLCWSSD